MIRSGLTARPAYNARAASSERTLGPPRSTRASPRRTVAAPNTVTRMVAKGSGRGPPAKLRPEIGCKALVRLEQHLRQVSAHRRPVGAEERAQLLRVELGLLERGEMPTARWLRHAHHVRCALEPRTRRADHVAGEERKTRWHLDPTGKLCGWDQGVRAVHAHR